MTLPDRLSISARHLRTGIVGVLLVMLATAVGVALASSTAAFISAYSRQTQRMLNDPSYREVVVKVGQPGEIAVQDLPVVPLEQKPTRSVTLTIDDVVDAAGAVPAVRHAYVLEPIELSFSSRDTNPGAAGSSRDTPRGEVVPVPITSAPGLQTTPAFFDAYGLAAAEGTLFVTEDLEAGNWVLVLGSNLAQAMFPAGGAVGSRIGLFGQTATVVGVLEPTGFTSDASGIPLDDTGFFPEHALAAIKRSEITEARFSAPDSAQLESAADQIATYFASALPNLDITVTTAAALLEEQRRVLARTLVVLAFLTAVGLFIAAINLLNLMLINVVRRAKPIAIMRALGWSRAQVIRQYFSESLLVCLVGAIAGAAVSPFAYQLLATTLDAGADFYAGGSVGIDLAAGALIGLAVTLAFAIYPAVVAGNTDPASAIRTE